jgi:phosphohistidine phosphatase SixA
MSRTTFTLAALLALCSPLSALAADLDVFLVRHAEKQTGPDPALTADGQARAQALANLLKDAGIAHIHSSDYQRTRDTAAPLAARLDLPVRLYDPRDLPAMAEKLRAEGGRHLVVGHSNTTPPLVEALGGEGGSPIIEATEYDRLYLVTITDNETETFLLRYGVTTP